MRLNRSLRRNRLVSKLCLLLWAGQAVAMAQTRLRSTDLPPLPMQQGKPNPGVAGAFAGISHGVLLVAGGANFPNGYSWQGGTKVWHSTVYALVKQGRSYHWQTVQPLGRPVGYGASAVWRNRVICVGGNDASRRYADVFTLTWDGAVRRLRTDSLPALPVALANGAATVAGDTLYVVGGESDRGTERSLYALSLLHPTSGWLRHADLPGSARAFTALVAVGGQLYVLGGRQTVGGRTMVYADAYAYQIRDDRWKQLPYLPTPLSAHGAVVTPDGAVWVVGGDTGERLTQIEQLNNQMAQQPSGSIRDSLTVRRNALQRDHPGFSRAVWTYRPRAKRWLKQGELSFAVPVTTPLVVVQGGFILLSGEVSPSIRTPACRRVVF
ncbi:kelch repeat-containing protein (plasmid) [Fibrella sp. ES10-3-2-2]